MEALRPRPSRSRQPAPSSAVELRPRPATSNPVVENRVEETVDSAQFSRSVPLNWVKQVVIIDSKALKRALRENDPYWSSRDNSISGSSDESSTDGRPDITESEAIPSRSELFKKSEVIRSPSETRPLSDPVAPEALPGSPDESPERSILASPLPVPAELQQDEALSGPVPRSVHTGRSPSAPYTSYEREKPPKLPPDEPPFLPSKEPPIASELPGLTEGGRSVAITGDTRPAPPSSNDGEHLRHRNLVLLLDCTTSEFKTANTNIVKIASVLQIDNRQLVYYDSGLGPPRSIASRGGLFKRQFDTVIDQTLAWDFAEHVQEGYRYLMNTYHDGDKIYIFGFSRGAFAARCLAGMVEKVGLLSPGNDSQIPTAYSLYINSQYRSVQGQLSQAYSRFLTLSNKVEIHFLGLFETVARLGFLSVKQMPFEIDGDKPRFFRHALALNERRTDLQPLYYVNPPSVKSAPHEITLPLASLEDRGQTRNLSDVKEVWFIGSHSDVGGGNEVEGLPSLSNISFRWMLREAVFCGIRLDAFKVLQQKALTSAPSLNEYLADVIQFIISGAGLENLIDGMTEQWRLRTLFERTLGQVPKLIEIMTERPLLRTRFNGAFGQGRLTKLVNQAANLDTYPNWRLLSDREKPSDLSQFPKESLTWGWIIGASYATIIDRSGAARRRRSHSAYFARFRYTHYGESSEIYQKFHRSIQHWLQYHPTIMRNRPSRLTTVPGPLSWVTWYELQGTDLPSHMWEV